ncbi:MAG: hypothetical protein WC723_00420 [Candidatus Omnitrophota bacterium]
MENNRRIFCLLPILLLFICLVLSGCGSGLELNSDWRLRQIAIDGKYTDWAGTGSYYNEKEKVLINLLNDNDYLYICLITRNRGIETKIMESGFTAWFDPGAGKNKVFGIRFPAGLKRMGMSIEDKKRDASLDWRDQEDKSGLIDREKERWRDKDFNKRLQTLEGLQGKLEIISGPAEPKDKYKHRRPPSGEAGKEGHALEKREGPPGSFFNDGRPMKELSLEEAEKLGIEAKVGQENDYFVYELKVPLTKSMKHPYAIETKAGKQIGLGLEISMSGMDIAGKDGGRAAPGGLMGLDISPEEGFQLWATVTLSPAH